MKPRTRYQRQVMATAKGMKPTTKRQIKWAFRECLEHYAFRTKSGSTTCLDCGHRWTIADEGEKRCQCPKCRARLNVENTLRRKARSSSYYTTTETKGGLQVLRTFLLSANYEKGRKAETWHTEICQYWINEKGKYALVGRQRTFGRYQDTFIYGSPMELRHDNSVYQHIASCMVSPEAEVIPQLARNGFDGDFHGFAPLTLFTALLSDSRIETLMKGKRMEEMAHFLQHPKALDLCWQSYLIARRRNYKIEDFNMWCDLIDLLDRHGKDLRNPHFICPDNLREEHDHWMQCWQRKEERQREERQRQWERERQEQEYNRLKKMEETKQEYLKQKAPFLNIVLTDGLITLHVLQSVDEFYEEGKSLSHCVFACNYFKKRESVILSARIADRRVETVEFSLKSFSVVQCHGKHNQNTEYHDRIVGLVNSNAEVFKQRMITA